MFFQQFPKIGYSFDLSDRGTLTSVTNIFSRFTLRESVLENAYAFYKYQCEDTDTPEIISTKEYGDPQYHWVVSFVNRAGDPLFDFPLEQDALERKIIKQYGYSSISEAYSNIHHYELETKDILNEVNGATTETVNTSIITLSQYDFSSNTLVTKTLNNPITTTVVFRANNSNINSATIATLTTTSTYKSVSVYDYEMQLNEKNRQIRLLKPEYIPGLVAELETILND